MKEYTIVDNFSKQLLIKEVESLLKQGWQIMGGISTTMQVDSMAGTVCHFAQALGR